MSIVPLAVLAVMGAAFLLPLIVPGQPGEPGWPRRRGRASGDGWRPVPGSGPLAGTGLQRPTPRQLARRRVVLRRRRVLLALAVAVALAVRVRYLLGGHWWIAEAVTGVLLLAYVGALVVQGWRRRAAPRAAPRTVAPERPARRQRWLVGRRARRRSDLSLWGAPLLDGQAPPRPE